MRWTYIPLLCCLALGCVSTPPPHPRALESNELCAQYVAAGDLEKAEVNCDHGLEFSPQYADLWVNKGIIALRRGQKDVAKNHFFTALRYNQEQAQAYNNLGYIYLQDRQFGKAHNMFQRALKVNPDYIEARYNLGFCFQQMGEKANARKEYHTLLAVSPNVADAHNNLGLMALEEHALEEAISELTRATELDPNFAEAWEHLGNAYSEAGKYAEAKDALTSCLEVDPNNVACRNNVVIVNRKLALLAPTLEELQETAGTENSAPALYRRALTFREKNLKAEEERYYKKCVKLDGKYAPCHYGLHLLFKEDHRTQEAIIACKNFLKFALADEFPTEVKACEQYVSTTSY